jgi:hypothetical protein
MPDDGLDDDDDQRVDREESTDREGAGPYLASDEGQAEDQHAEGKRGEQHAKA